MYEAECGLRGDSRAISVQNGLVSVWIRSIARIHGGRARHPLPRTGQTGGVERPGAFSSMPLVGTPDVPAEQEAPVFARTDEVERIAELLLSGRGVNLVGGR